jgi:hypothetical protein
MKKITTYSQNPRASVKKRIINSANIKSKAKIDLILLDKSKCLTIKEARKRLNSDFLNNRRGKPEIDDLRFSARTKRAWKRYDKGEFKSMEFDKFIEHLKKFHP